MRRLLVACCLSLLLLAGDAGACTIISGRAPDGTVWTGNNEDYSFSFDTYLNVLPRDANGLGAIAFTYFMPYDRPEPFVQGGLNEKGLFFDLNALPAVPASAYQGWDRKRDFPGGAAAFLKRLLRTCATVPEVIALCDTFRAPEIFLSGQLHVADRSGNLAIINADSVCLARADYQISTNFDVCTQRSSPGALSCWRFPIAERLLAARGVSYESFRVAMDSTQQRRGVSTIYTNLANLSTGDIDFYYAGDFRTAYHFTIQGLLSQGKRSYLMRELFRDAPIVRIWEVDRAQGGAAAVRYSERMRDTLPEPVRVAALRHLFCDGLYNTSRFADARVLVEEWLKTAGGRDPAASFYEGLARLTTGDPTGARACLARQAAADSADPVARRAYLPGVRALLARLDGTPLRDANVRFELKGHHDARFVSVYGVSLWPLYAFLTRTADGWAGDFALPPGKLDYAFVVDGRLIRDPANPEHETVSDDTGQRDLSVRTIP